MPTQKKQRSESQRKTSTKAQMSGLATELLVERGLGGVERRWPGRSSR